MEFMGKERAAYESINKAKARRIDGSQMRLVSRHTSK